MWSVIFWQLCLNIEAIFVILP